MVGLGVPMLAIVGMEPVLARAPWFYWGLPCQVWWMFACIPLTSLCLFVAWRMQNGDEGAE